MKAKDEYSEQQKSVVMEVVTIAGERVYILVYRICHELTVEIKFLNESWKVLLSEPLASLIKFWQDEFK